MSPRGPRLRAALRDGLAPGALTLAGTAAGIAIGIARGAPNWPVYLVVVLSGVGLVAMLHARAPLSRITLWGLAVFALGHVAGGMVPVGDGVLYQQWLLEPVVRYDNLQHAWGFGWAGRATWEVLRGRLGPQPAADPIVAATVVVLGASGLGAANEIIEWILTLTIPGTDVGGYDNTARDLVANLVGGVALAAATVRGGRTATRGRARRSAP